MRARVWCMSLLLVALGIACGDQPTEVVVDREVVAASGMAAGPRVLAAATTTTEDGLTISTDKDDYAPGDTVWFTGSGWPVDDVLDILLTEEPLTHPPHEWTIAVGSDGTFRDSTYVVDEGDLDVTFTLVATSRSTGRSLTVMFTDGNLQLQPNPTPDPFSPNADGTKDASVITYRNQGSGTESNIQLSVRQGTALANTLVRSFGPFTLIQNASGSVTWDGTNSASTVVAEGEYGIRVFNIGQTEATASGQRLYIALVDVTAPVISLPALSPSSVTQGVSTPVAVTGRATDNAVSGVPLNRYQPTAAEYRVDAGGFANMGLASTSPNVVNARSLSATISGPTVAGLSAGNHLVCIRATDNAGNTGHITIAGNPNCATLQVVSADNLPPTISCTVPSSTPWYAADVSVPCTATDASGLANPTDASFTLSTAVAVNSETSAASTNSRTVCDTKGNCATAGPFVFKVDKKAPTVSCGSPDSDWHGSDVSISCTAQDLGSGLANVGDASFDLSTSVANGTEIANASTDTRVVKDAVENSTTAGPIAGNKVDKKAPTFDCDVPDGSWHDDDVTLHCTAADGGSGLAAAADASFDLSTDVPGGTETANAATGSRTVEDKVNNSATAGPIGGNKIDKKAPVVSCGAADGDWHADDVSISCIASDAGSGLKNTGDASFHLSTTVPAGTENPNASTGSRAVLDNVNHTTTAGPITGNKIDKKAPVVACGAADGNWHATDVSINCTATDGGSGLVDADGAFSLITNVPANTETDNASTNSQNVLDKVGNSTTAGPVGGNKVDKKAPAVACGTADGIWHASDVSIACTATDGGSGLATLADAGFSLLTSVTAETETANAATSSRNVPDAVGNTATAGPITGNKVDKKGPVVALTCPASPLLLNAPASASWTATDGGSGVAAGYEFGSFGVPTNSVGPKTAVAAAGIISRDNVGNTNSASPPCSYAVHFNFAGFRTPVDNNGVLNTANSGQAIPLKWELRDHAGNPVTTLASVMVTVTTLSCSYGTTTDLIEEYASGSSGLQNHGGGSYQFNWKTPTSYAKSCKTMKLDLGEGIFRTAVFEFRK